MSRMARRETNEEQKKSGVVVAKLDQTMYRVILRHLLSSGSQHRKTRKLRTAVWDLQ